MNHELKNEYIINPIEIVGMMLVATAASSGGCNLDLARKIIPQLKEGPLRESLIEAVERTVNHGKNVKNQIK